MSEPLRGKKQNEDDWWTDSVTHGKERFFFEEDVKSASEFYLKYFDNQLQLFKDYPNLLQPWMNYTKLNSIYAEYDMEFNRWLFRYTFEDVIE